MAITDGTIPQTATPVTPTPVANTADLDLSLDLPPVAKETTPDTDWLKEEDKLTQKVETLAPSSKLQAPSIPQDEVLSENLPQEAKDMTLKDDMNIIQELQLPQVQENVIQAKNQEVTNMQPATLNSPHDEVNNVQPVTMNLDSIL